MFQRQFLVILTLSCLMATVAPADQLSPVEALGKDIFFDESLSEPPGQSCATCHGPEAGFAGADTEVNALTAAYPGAVATRFSNRKPPTTAYAGDAPVLHLEAEEGEDGDDDDHDDSHAHELAEGELFVGGLFFDGRAHGWKLQDPLAEQAQGPFLNPLEQNLPDTRTVIELVEARYGTRFEALFGPDALDPVGDPEGSYDLLARVIAAFERSAEMNPYSSKYDHYLRGEATLTAAEQRGLELFEGKALCSECHPSQLGPDGELPLFTDFTYDNLGVPRNPRLPFYQMPAETNPDGEAYVDPGLAGFLATHPVWAHLADDNLGKHKVPTLRNVDARPDPEFVKVYMHNGVFTTLEEVVEFYNTRDVGDWPPAEVTANVNVDELGDLKLTPAEEADVVTFMRILTDGWQPTP